MTVEKQPKLSHSIRNLVAFWCLGLCNNFGYVVMLSAAHDLLKDRPANATIEENIPKTEFSCNIISTGAILLADILPSLAIKMVSPFFFTNLHARVLVAVIFSALGFYMVAITTAPWMTYIGVISTAFSSGLGEVTFLRFSSHFNRNVISSWSSGTGGAGVLGSFLYTALIQVGLSHKVTLEIMLAIPILEAISFWVIVHHPPATRLSWSSCCRDEAPRLEKGESLEEDPVPSSNNADSYTLLHKLKLIKPLLIYMIPLGLVYLFEYYINQGLTELTFFKGAIVPDMAGQYRWYSVLYQVGVFISRTAGIFFQVKRLWILALLQLLNVVLIVLQILFFFAHSIWWIFAIIVFEGLVGGCAYVSAFYRISEDIQPEHREYSMGVASLSESIGISLAAVLSLPTHNVLCRYLLVEQF